MKMAGSQRMPEAYHLPILAAGHDFVISGDLNELLGDNHSGFGSITTEFSLVDVYRHRHGMDEPATFNCGHSRVDYILCSVPLLPSVSACDILPFSILSQSDHRTVFVDFDKKTPIWKSPIPFDGSGDDPIIQLLLDETP
jgi:hypothetical protein